MSDEHVYLLNENQFKYYWPQIEECLDAEPELWNRYHTKESLVSLVIAGRGQVWAVSLDEVIRYVLFTFVQEAPAGRTLQVWWMFGHGEFERALPHIEYVMSVYALEMGCKGIEVTGRKGFERVLKSFGARFAYSTWYKPVDLRRNN